MITVTISGMGQTYRIDTPDASLIGPWLAALFNGIKPSGRMPGYFTIDISGGA